jgi:hypothetical protein
MGGAGKIIALILNLLVVGMLVVFGILGSRRHLWPFIAGLVLLALDGVLFLLARDWIGVGFHALVLFFLFRGMQACRALRSQ